MKQMSKKQELRLKTIDVSDLIAKKTQTAFAPKSNPNPDSPYKNAIRHKTQNAPILVNVLKKAKKQEIMRQKVQQLVDQARHSPLKLANPKDSLKQFPKREKSIKNSNPYRYFQSSKSERVIPDYRIPTQPIMQINFTKIMKERYNLRFKSHSIASRIHTEYQIPIEPRKTFIRAGRLPFKMEESFTSALQPWLQIDDPNPFPSSPQK